MPQRGIGEVGEADVGQLVGPDLEQLQILEGAQMLHAPVGDLVPAALKAVARGGIVVCAGIHMSTIPAFPYKILWGERSIKSVANLTRRDGEEFLPLAARIPIVTETELHELGDANLALNRLRNGQLKGAAVLKMNS